MKLGVTNIATNIVYKYKMFHNMVHTNKQKMWTFDIHESPGAIPLHWIAAVDTPNPKVQTVTVNSKFFCHLHHMPLAGQFIFKPLHPTSVCIFSIPFFLHFLRC